MLDNDGEEETAAKEQHQHSFRVRRAGKRRAGKRVVVLHKLWLCTLTRRGYTRGIVSS